MPFIFGANRSCRKYLSLSYVGHALSSLDAALLGLQADLLAKCFSTHRARKGRAAEQGSLADGGGAEVDTGPALRGVVALFEPGLVGAGLQLLQCQSELL